MGAWGYNVLQNDDALDFAHDILKVSSIMAKITEEDLVLYEIIKAFNIYDEDVFDQIRTSVDIELKYLKDWKEPEKRKAVLEDILKDLDKREQSIKEAQRATPEIRNKIQ